MVANLTDELLSKTTVLGIAEEVTEELVDRINAWNSPRSLLLNYQQR